MRENNYEACVKTYQDIGDFEEELHAQRSATLKLLPHSVIAEGSYPELDMADQWLHTNVGNESENTWQKIWYGKIAYDYGFTEYFFKDATIQRKFADEIKNFYGEGPKGKWKTDGHDKYIDL